MWLDRQMYTTIYRIAAISVPMLLASCENASSPEMDAQTSSSLPGLTQQPDTVLDDSSRLANDQSPTELAPSSLSFSNLRAGYVSLEWTPSRGDTAYALPSDDTVSYYRILRNGEPWIDTLSPSIEDTNPPEGEVTYAVQAIKFDLSPAFSISHSQLTEHSGVVPSFAMEKERLNALEIDAAIVQQSLDRLQSCVIAYTQSDGSSVCTNDLGHAWRVSITGESSELLPHTSSVGGEFYVTVENRDTQIGPIPGIPEWIVKNIATGESIRRDLSLEVYLNSNERILVNGVAVSDSSEVFVSGSIYQSFIPRSLGPSPGVLPVTNGYYIAQLDGMTGEVIKFQRYTLSNAFGAVASISNGVLELFQTGLVTQVDAKSLTAVGALQVSGSPIFANEAFVYTQTAELELNANFLQFAR